jgi:FkbM family methyltransferase
MAAGVGPTGMVLAFEPQAELADCLRETLAMGSGGSQANPRFEVYQQLLSNGVEDLKFCSNGTGRSRIPITSSAEQMSIVEKWPVQTLCSTTIDLTVLGRSTDGGTDITKAYRAIPRVCVLKLDVEGHEFEVSSLRAVCSTSLFVQSVVRLSSCSL